MPYLIKEQHLRSEIMCANCRHRILLCPWVNKRLHLICGNKMPTRCNRWIFIADLIASSTCFGNHYAHHQELESIIQVVAACRIWCFGFQVAAAAAARKPDTQPSAPHRTDNLKTKHQIRQAATTCIIFSSSWWWA